MNGRRMWMVLGILVLTTILMVGLGLTQDQGMRASAAPPGDVGAAPAAPLGTGFTYQGRLTEDDALVNGTCDFRFGLFDQAGSAGTSLGVDTVNGVPVEDGLFTV